MGAFNTWLGFPARNAIYLDRDFDRQRGNGQAAYGTFQTAYNAASALATTLGERVVIMVGEGTAAQFGNLVLAANWNTNVSISGINKHASTVGTITGTVALGTGFNVVLTASNITIGAITSTGIIGGGAVTITGNGIGAVTLGAIDTSSTDGLGGGGSGGAVALTDVSVGAITSLGDTFGGNVTFTRTFSSGAIAANSDSGTPGIVVIDDQSTCGNIDIEGLVGDGFVTITDGSVVGSVTVGNSAGNNSFTIRASRASAVTMGGSNVTVIVDDSIIGDLRAGNGVFSLTSRDSKIGAIDNSNASSNVLKIYGTQISSNAANCLSIFTNGSVINQSVLAVSGVGNVPCIGDLAGSTLGLIVDSSLIPSGTGVCIDASVASTVIVRNVSTSNDVGVNVTADGDLFIVHDFISPI